MNTHVKVRAELTWRTRIALALVAFSGSTLYAWSFSHFAKNFVPLATAVGLTAGVSWMCFGLLLLLVTKLQVKATLLADVCLRAMAVGIAIKMTSVLLNLVTFVPLSFHCGVLVVANLAMAAIFSRGAGCVGVRLRDALLLWFVGLNGIFSLTLFVLKRMEVW